MKITSVRRILAEKKHWNMNHIGAKTEVNQTAWEQLAQTQNYDHPIRSQQVATSLVPLTPTSAPKPPLNSQPQANNNAVAGSQPPQQPAQSNQQQQPEYGEELHPELVNDVFFCNNFVLICFLLECIYPTVTLAAGTTRMEKVLVKEGESTVLLEQDYKWVAVGNARAESTVWSADRSTRHL